MLLTLLCVIALSGGVKVQEIKLKFLVLTPMFLAGADQGCVELRSASVKGQLRFWWRAQHPGLSPAELWQREGEIFGFAGEKKNRRSSFALLMEEIDLRRSRNSLPNADYTKFEVQRSDGRTIVANFLEYLAYGTYERNKEQKRNILIREYLAPGSTFRLTLRFREDKHLEEVVKALKAFILFGGLGSKSRNGYGSFRVTVEDAPEKIKQEIEQLKPDKPFMQELCSFKGVPSFSAFCKGARLFRTKDIYPSWDRCLVELARAYREARLSLERKHVYEKRQYLGAPLIVDQKQRSFADRHAKPYFIRVHKEKEGFRGYILYLPSQYLPRQHHERLGIQASEFRERDLERDDQLFQDVCREVNRKLQQFLEVVF